MSLVHLHTHSEFSLLDGLNRIERMVDAVIALGQPALALTDHGVMYGVVDFYKTCEQKGIKPIIGCELYFTDRSRHQKENREDAVNYHMVLLAKNDQGYRNLCKLVSLAHIEGFYYKPRIDWELLEKHCEGLVMLSACIKGHVPSLLLQGRPEEARETALRYQKLFGPDFYLELQNHGLEEQLKVNPLLAELGKSLGISLVATQDAHYPTREDAFAHDLLLCVQTLSDYDDPQRLRFSNQEFYIKSYEEMQKLFKDYPQALQNTLEVADKCNLKLTLGQLHLPVYQKDKPLSLEERVQYLRELCYTELPRRYGDPPSQEARDRLEFEIKVIENMKFVDYFLVVQDFVNEAKRRNIFVGPGRGSAAGSIVSYLLGITGIDPLRYKLYFERFLNPERIDMPDIDIDFEDERRDEVIAYVREKYGDYKVAQVATFGRMEARGVIRDVARAFKYDNSWVNRLCKTIPFGNSLTKAYDLSPEFRQIIDSNEDNRRLYDTALQMEGQTRNFSVHAAGVVIGDTELWDYVPLQMDKNKNLVIQYDKKTVEAMGLLKIDFLGLRNLTVLRECIQLIEEHQGKKVDLESIPLDDPLAIDIYKRASTRGVFQVESRGMRQVFKELNPETIEDVIAVIALYRPGPMDLIKNFIKNKANPENIVYEHEALRPILESTYGICVYQEQVMSIVQEMANFSLGEADSMRKAVSKKDKEKMDELKIKFVENALQLGYEDHVVKSISEKLEPFSSYGFNRSHAAAYGVISFQTAYFKAHYSLEYMTALLNSIKDDENKLSEYIQESRQMKIAVLPPDINASQVNFSIEGTSIRYGLLAIKNAGKIALEMIIENRNEKGLFKSLGDFNRRMTSGKVNKKVIESLIKAGAFDSLDPDRAYLLDHASEASIEEASLFGPMEDFQQTVRETRNTKMDFHNHLNYEKEALGFYFSMHPLTPYQEIFSDINVPPLEEIQEEISEQEKVVEVFGIIDSIRMPRKKQDSSNGNTIAILKLSDLSSSQEFIAFGKTAENLLQTHQQETAAWLQIRLKREEDRVRAIVADIKRLISRDELLREQQAHWRLELSIDLDVAKPDDLRAIKELFAKYPGPHSIHLMLKRQNWLVHAGTVLQVEKNPRLIEDLNLIAGTSSIGWKRCLS